MIKTHILYLFLLACPMLLLSQETVHISGTEFGRGILKDRKGECFVIAPFHVVENDDKLVITGDKLVQSEALLIKSFPADIAVLRISKGGMQNCQKWTTHQEFDFLLNGVYEGFIELRNNLGSVNNTPVIITEYDDSVISIRPKSKYGTIKKGMSGGSLFTIHNSNKVYLGMLQEVDEGIGYVLQADDMDRILKGFFTTQTQPKKTDTISKTKFTEDYNKLISTDIQFLEDHFKEIQRSTSHNLSIKFQSFLNRAQKRYSEYPSTLDLSNSDKRQYQSLISDISYQFDVCERIISKTPENWQVEATPQISMLIIYIQDLLQITN